MIEAYILIELSSGSKYKYVRDVVNDSNGIGSETYQYSGAAYQEVGLKRKHPGMNTGLKVGETYYFRVNVDGGGVNEYGISLNNNSQGFIDYGTLVKELNSATTGATWSMFDGQDLRCTSDSETAGSSIVLTAGISGTDLFSSLGGFTVLDTPVAGDLYLDQTGAGKVLGDFTTITASYTGASAFNDLLTFPEAIPTTVLKRKNLANGKDDKTYTYLQIPVGEIVAISVIEDIKAL